METRRILFILILAGIVLAAALALNCGSLPGPEAGTGTLAGNVTIGPLCPVEPCSVPRERLDSAYAAWPITVSTPGGTAVATVTADPETGYSFVLKPGTYVVSIPHTWIGGSRELPQTVTIRSGATVRLDIAIDTGIR
jgi:hypothetical protein